MARSKKETMYLTGDERLNRKLRRLSGKEQKKVLTKAAREAMKPIQKTARTLAPKRKGKLRRSIKVKALKRSRSRIGIRVTTNDKDNLFTGRTYYGGFVHYGTKHIDENPFMKRTADRQKRRALVIYRRRSYQGIRKLAQPVSG